MATKLSENFSDPDYSAGETWTYNGNGVGGLHVMCIVGYDDSLGLSGAFKVRNSWGVNWGDAGYCWISYESCMHERAHVYCLYVVEEYDSNVAWRFCTEFPVLLPPREIAFEILLDIVYLSWEPVDGPALE